MKKEYFVKKIIENVRDSALYSMEINLEKPAGRNPDKKLLELSNWYHGLNENDQKCLKNVIMELLVYD